MTAILRSAETSGSEAQDLWADFSDKWKPWRHKAAMKADRMQEAIG